MSAVFRFNAGAVKVVENTSKKYGALPYSLILVTSDHNGWNITRDVSSNTLTRGDAVRFHHTALEMLGIERETT